MRHQISIVRLGAAVVVAGLAATMAACGGGSDSGSGAASTVTVTVTDPTPTDTEATDAFEEAAGTTDTSVEIGQGVDETCEDLVAFIVLARDTGIARGGDSVGDVERLAASASELASQAPKDERGEPRDSVAAIALAYNTYLSVLSETGMEPGPDALLEPRVAEAFEDVALQFGLGIAPWMDEHCSPEILSQVAAIGSG